MNTQRIMSQTPILNIKLNSFDGPLDLLENLIREHKLDILNLDILELTVQYLAYIERNINTISIDEASDYLSMATHLLELKSKKILLMESLTTDSDFEYERDKLVKQIIEYRKYKETLPKFLLKKDLRMEHYGKSPDDLEQYIEQNVAIADLPESIDANKLLIAMQKALEKYRFMLFTRQKIIVQELAVDVVESDILDFLKQNPKKKISFSDFLSSIDELKLTFQYVVTTFLALLELVKYRQINLSQNDFNDDLFFIMNPNEDEVKNSLIRG
jgi:segregation and condensation protein A